MPAFNVTMKDDTTDAELKAAKDLAISQGGKITKEFTLIPAFTVEFPADTVTTLATQEGVLAVEADQIMTTQ